MPPWVTHPKTRRALMRRENVMACRRAAVESRGHTVNPFVCPLDALVATFHALPSSNLRGELPGKSASKIRPNMQNQVRGSE